ncbi:MAG: hypothetical protein ABEJ65_01730 [bacterium]
MKHTRSFIVLAVVTAFLVAAVSPLSAEIKIGEYEDVSLYTEIHTTGTFQAFDESHSDGGAPDIGPSLQTAWGNMDWRVTREGYWEMFFDVTMASRVKTDRWWGHQGYIRVNKFPNNSPASALNPVFENIDLKAGHFSVGFGDQLDRRSINADVQENPVIGNYLVTPEATEPGMEVIADQGPVKGLIGVGIGDSTENFKKDRGWSYHAKVWGNVTPNLKLSGSYYTVDHSEIQGAHGGPGHLFSTDRSTGTRFGGLDGFNGLISPGNGYDVMAYQGDIDWDITPQTNVNAHFGMMEDADVNGTSGDSTADGTPKEEWTYYGADVTHYVSDNVYLAGRYSVADADILEEETGTAVGGGDVQDQANGSNPDKASQLEAGVGAWLTKRMLLKATYVDASAENLGDYSGNLDNQEFSGVISEMSITF